METIRTYIENLFMALPDTEEARTLKAELLASNQEKFLDLLKAGKNEQEAIGQVLQEFGSLDELQEILGVKDFEAVDSTKEAERNQMVQEYVAFKKRFALMIAGGIGMIFLGLILQSFFDGLESEVGQMAGFFIPIGIGVGMFIYAGIQDDSYKSYFKQERMVAYLDEYEIQTMNGQSRVIPESSALESAFWMLVVGIYLYLGFVKGLWHPGWIIFIFASALIAIVKWFQQKK